MTTDEQATMDQLSRTVTALCLAIDPDSTHGPDTDKIVAYQQERLRLAKNEGLEIACRVVCEKAIRN